MGWVNVNFNHYLLAHPSLVDSPSLPGDFETENVFGKQELLWPVWIPNRLPVDTLELGKLLIIQV